MDIDAIDPENWWTGTEGRIWPAPIRHATREHPPEAGKPGPLVFMKVIEASGGLFRFVDLNYEITGAQAGELVWAVRGRHGHPLHAKLEFFRAVEGAVYAEVHSARGGCTVVKLDRPDETYPIDAGVWHAAWVSPGSRLFVSVQGGDTFDVSFNKLPCSCDRREFLLRHGLNPDNDPTLRAK